MAREELPLGIVLAGGRSRRMGFDKARFRPLGDGGPTLAELAADRLADAGLEVVLADHGRKLVEGLTSIGDGPGAGPVAGLLGAAAHAPGRALLVLACDLPLVPSGLLAAMSAISADWVVPRWDRGLEPTAALYRPRALAALARRVGLGKLGLKSLADEAEIATHFFSGSELESWGRPDRIFLNLNRPEDLRHLTGVLHGRFTGG